MMAKVGGVSAEFMGKGNCIINGHGNGVVSTDQLKSNGKVSGELHANLNRKEKMGDGVVTENGKTIVSSPNSLLLPLETENNNNVDSCFSSAIPGWYADAPPLWPGLLHLLLSPLFFFSFLF